MWTVVTPGKDFDNCVVGGLYEAPNSGTPTEYRIFADMAEHKTAGHTTLITMRRKVLPPEIYRRH